MKTMLIGLVKWFDSEKGFGVIGTPDNGEYFLHINSFLTKPLNVSKKTAIIFSEKIDKRKNRKSADDCRLVGELSDWSIIFSYFGKPDSVIIEVETTGRGLAGNSYTRKENKSFSLIDLAAKQFFRFKSKNEISKVITDYFDNELDYKHFTSYCSFIERRITRDFPTEDATSLLDSIYTYFGNHLNDEILFQVWKSKTFKYISFTDQDEYEIPINVFDTHITELDISDLSRIKNFSYGADFCTQLVVSKFEDIERLSSPELNSLFPLIEFDASAPEMRRRQFDDAYKKVITKEIIEKAEKLAIINNDQDYYHYNKLNQLIPSQFSDEDKASIISKLNKIIVSKSSEEYTPELWLKGLIADVPRRLIKLKINELDGNSITKIIEGLSHDKSFIKELLEEKILKVESSSYSWLYDLAIKYLDEANFESFDKHVFDSFDHSEYFKIWKSGKAKLFPESFIRQLINDNYETYSQIETWITKKATTREEITGFMLAYLNEQTPVTDRIVFHRQSNHIKYLVQSNELLLQKIVGLKSSFYDLILWFLDKNETLEFEILKQKFIYFTPDEQVRIIRRLFFLKATNQFDLTLDKLDELLRFDMDLYKSNLESNPDLPVDISTDVVIKALISFRKNQKFFVENELLSVILKDLNLDRTRRFKLSNYFEKCKGRETAKINWRRQGNISKVTYGDDKFYFAIDFEYNADIVERVKEIPGRKWNNETRIWGVPSQYEQEVLDFAKENRFFLEFEGNVYANNVHLTEFKREEIPNGLIYCEGRLSNRLDKVHNKEFWWCMGQPCYSKCETIHPPNEWEKYTLLDFCEILGLNTDETNSIGDHIPKGHYYQFISLINRFNRLLEKLYCNDCNHILHPIETGHYAAYNVVRFHCANDACPNNEEIYLNHCLNGQCNNIIDSRVSKKCSNGLFICDNCGSCCSHDMLTRRLMNLEKLGGHIHNNLRKCVDNKLGHLERAEYYCYKCKSVMKEISDDIFQCPSCNIKYDTTKYHLKRPHIYLKEAAGQNREKEIEDNELDLPF